VDAVTDLELGGAEGLGVGVGREPAGLVQARLLQDFEEALGVGLLLGGGKSVSMTAHREKFYARPAKPA
jgi:hypothetical protein